MMMEFPTNHHVHVLPRINGAADAHGNPIASFGKPLRQAVYCWYPVASSEASEQVGARESLTQDLYLLTPPEFLAGPHDRIKLGHLEFDIVGYPADYGHGPFGVNPGKQYRLRRVEA